MHQKWQEQIPYYVTGRLAVTERSALETHLEGCAACRKRLMEWQLIANAVQTDANGRTNHLPPLDHARYVVPKTRSLPEIISLQTRPTSAANGSQPAQNPPPRERKKEMAISSLPVSRPRASGNAVALLLVGLFLMTLVVGGLNNFKFPTPGSSNPIIGYGIQNVSETPSPTPTGTERPPTRTPHPTIVPPTFDPSVTPPTRLPTHIPPTLLPSRTPQCIILIVVPGLEQFFERLAHFLRSQGFCVTLIYPTPRPTFTPGSSPTPRPTIDPSVTPPTRLPTNPPPTHPPSPTRPPTFTPVPGATEPPTPTRPPTIVPPTHLPTFTPFPTNPPPATPTRPTFPTNPPPATHWPTFTPFPFPTNPPPPTHPPFPTNPPPPATFTPRPPPTFPPPPTHPPFPTNPPPPTPLPTFTPQP